MLLATLEIRSNVPPAVRDKLVRSIQRNIRALIAERTKTDSSGELVNSLSVVDTGSSILVISDAEYAKAVDSGTKARTPYELIGKVIPIYSNVANRIIYRKVTAIDVLRGKWYRRAVPGKNFVRDGVTRALGEFSDLHVVVTIS